MSFGQQLKSLRKSKDISQRELADKSGVSAAELSRVESGSRKRVAPYVLRAISPHLDVSYESLLSGAGYLDVAKVTCENIVKKEVKALKNEEPSEKSKYDEILDSLEYRTRNALVMLLDLDSALSGRKFDHIKIFCIKPEENTVLGKLNCIDADITEIISRLSVLEREAKENFGEYKAF